MNIAAAEITADGIDNDCDSFESCFADLDGDTWGSGTVLSADDDCVDPGEAALGGDCDDGAPAVNPGLPPGSDQCDGVDSDCDGPVDEDGLLDWWVDGDGDGLGAFGTPVTQTCVAPTGFVGNPSDCDDADPGVGMLTWYADTDGDGFGDAADAVVQCPNPSARSLDSTDCDDTDPAVNPAALEVCFDFVDNDCEPTTSCRLVGSLSLSDADAKLYGGDDLNSVGVQVLGPGDITGDGVPDYVASQTGLSTAVYVGPATVTGAVDLAAASTAEFGDGGGSPLTGAIGAIPDWNSDGMSELAVGWSGPPGSVYVFEAPLSGTLLSSDAVSEIIGLTPGTGTGTSIGGLYADSDAVGDIAVGAPLEDTPAGAFGGGSAFVLFGPVAGGASVGGADVRIDGDLDGDELGTTVVGFDISGDGAGDVILSAPGALDAGAPSGQIHAFFGPMVAGAFTSVDADLSLSGESPGDRLGRPASAGDINGDGSLDIVATKQNLDPQAPNTGAAYVIFGPPADQFVDNADVRIYGVDPYPQVGGNAVTAGDTDGDGFDDLLLESMSSHGERAHLFYGPISGVLSPTDAQVSFMSEYATNEAGTYSAPLGDFDTDGYDDFLIGERNTCEQMVCGGAVYLYRGNGL